MTNREKLNSLDNWSYACTIARVIDNITDCDRCPISEECENGGNVCAGAWSRWLEKEYTMGKNPYRWF